MENTRAIRSRRKENMNVAAHGKPDSSIRPMNAIPLLSNAWVLYELEQPYRLVLSVLCGGVALYELNIELTHEEREEYMAAGAVVLEALADKVRTQPHRFQSHHVKLTSNDPDRQKAALLPLRDF